MSVFMNAWTMVKKKKNSTVLYCTNSPVLKWNAKWGPPCNCNYFCNCLFYCRLKVKHSHALDALVSNALLLYVLFTSSFWPLMRDCQRPGGRQRARPWATAVVISTSPCCSAPLRENCMWRDGRMGKLYNLGRKPTRVNELRWSADTNQLCFCLFFFIKHLSFLFSPPFKRAATRLERDRTLSCALGNQQHSKAQGSLHRSWSSCTRYDGALNIFKVPRAVAYHESVWKWRAVSVIWLERALKLVF